MSFSRPFQWYHSHADVIWPDGGTFKCRMYSGIANIMDLLDILHNMYICPRVYRMCTWLKGLAKVVTSILWTCGVTVQGVYYMHKEVWHHRRKMRIRTTFVKSSFIFRPASLSPVL
jgi:hypothetical protein